MTVNIGIYKIWKQLKLLVNLILFSWSPLFKSKSVSQKNVKENVSPAENTLCMVFKHPMKNSFNMLRYYFFMAQLVKGKKSILWNFYTVNFASFGKEINITCTYIRLKKIYWFNSTQTLFFVKQSFFFFLEMHIQKNTLWTWECCPHCQTNAIL